MAGGKNSTETGLRAQRRNGKHGTTQLKKADKGTFGEKNDDIIRKKKQSSYP